MRVCILIHAHESLGEQVTVGNVAENMVVTSQFFLMSLAHLLRHWMTSRVVWTRSLFALAVLHILFFLRWRPPQTSEATYHYPSLMSSEPPPSKLMSHKQQWMNHQLTNPG